jgi:DNA-binding response OmpR family regulator
MDTSLNADDARPSLVVIDDEPELCSFIAEVAEMAGYKPITFSDGNALASLDLHAIDAVVLDLSMPSPSGPEILSTLGNAGCSAPVLLVSGFDSTLLEASASLGRRRGANVVGTAQKPLRMATLLALLKNLATPT